MALLDHERFPEIHTAYVLVGRGDTDFDREPRFISVTLDVGETGSRDRTSNEIGRAAADVGEQMVPGMQARLGGARAGGQGQPVKVRIFGNDLDTLTQVAADGDDRDGSPPGAGGRHEQHVGGAGDDAHAGPGPPDGPRAEHPDGRATPSGSPTRGRWSGAGPRRAARSATCGSACRMRCATTPRPSPTCR